MASDNLEIFSFSTKMPPPSANNCAGPSGQSNATEGIPKLIASTKTMGKPSYLDDNTKKALFANSPFILSVYPKYVPLQAESLNLRL